MARKRKYWWHWFRGPRGERGLPGPPGSTRPTIEIDTVALNDTLATLMSTTLSLEKRVLAIEDFLARDKAMERKP